MNYFEDICPKKTLTLNDLEKQ